MSAAARKNFLDTILKNFTIRQAISALAVIATVIVAAVKLSVWAEHRITLIELTQQSQYESTNKAIGDLKTAIEHMPKCNCAHEQQAQTYYGTAGIRQHLNK